MDTYTVAPYPRIRDWLYVRPVAAVYVPVLSDLTVRDQRGVTLGELGSAVPRPLDGCLVFERRRVALLS